MLSLLTMTGMNFRFLFLFIACSGWLNVLSLHAQDGDLLLNDDTYHLIDRLDVRGQVGQPMQTFSRPYARESVAEWLRMAQKNDSFPVGKRMAWWMRTARRLNDDAYNDSFHIALPDSVRKRKFPLYKNDRDFIQYHTAGFRLYVNPVLYLNAGTDRYTTGTGTESQFLYRNGKGASLRGRVGQRLGIYADFTDTQVQYPEFTRQEIQRNGAVPSENNFKTTGTKGYDFLNARAYVTYTPTKYLRIKLGRDRAFWGNGYQSFVLSDHATDYYLLNLHLRVGKFEYQCLFNQMVDFIPNKPDVYGTYPKKYGAMHQLSFYPDRRIGITFMESTVYAPVLPNGQRGVELQYFNPLIFYRSVEAALGSPDNTFIGMAVKANILRHYQLYGQLLVDDYNFSERKNGAGWWGNKYGFQAGIKAIDLFNIETFDLQLEYNTARPYAFGHYNVSANYTHYGQLLGHPMGANFRETTLILRYMPLPKFYTVLTLVYLQKGEDLAGLNSGGNPFRTNLTHDNGSPNPDYGNNILQGNLRTDQRVQFRVSYQPFVTPLIFEAEAYYRRTKMTDTYTDAGGYLQIRYFFSARSVRY